MTKQTIDQITKDALRMKKILCYLATLKELLTVFMAWTNFGAIYINHDYIEVYEKFNKKTRRIVQRLRCRRCGEVSDSWRQL